MTNTAAQAPPAIEVTNLRKRYRGTPEPAVDDVSLTIGTGEIFGIIGPNGAGKTTTVECIAGLREPDSGTVTVLGLDPVNDRDEIHQILGVQLQESQFPDRITVAEILDLYSSFYRDPADWRELMDLVGLTAKSNTRYQALSGGQKQRLSIALALVGTPEVAILDELTTGLDPQARRDTWGLIERVRDTGVTIVLVTHFMDEAERLCDRIAVIDNGRVAAVDTPGGLVSRTNPTRQVRFRLRHPLDEDLIADLPGITGVEVTGERWVVTGTGEVLGVVAGALARAGLVAEELRTDERTLDDAFVAFTGYRGTGQETAS
ncbi:MAG: ABC transporter ATP-binding protein [Corynebacterium sp.]|uniref:ABC transporter ATP-binding protein n=1 Tax=Corynebacterium sp. TaxID=1720 RepID=UPI003F9444D2